jgi:PAS domain S-box-containing protein
MTMAASVLLHIYACETNRQSRGDALQAAGFYVIENAGGEAAMALASAHTPALILLDLKLPNRDGYEVCRDLKRSADMANVPVLAISAVGDGEDEYAKALESGASAYLREPVAPAVLVSTVRALIRAREIVFASTADPEKKPSPHSCQTFGNADLILDSLSEALVVLDSSSRITYLNASAARLLSQSADALLGKDVWEAYPQAVGTPIHREYLRTIRDRTPVHCEIVWVSLQRWFDVRAFPIPDGGIIAHFHDITEWKRAESKLHESQERLKLATEGAGLAAWDFDLTTGDGHWSRDGFELLGYASNPDGRATMEMWRSRIHPEDLTSVMETFNRAKRERGIYQLEHRIIRADDRRIRWVTVFGHFQDDQNGVAARFAGVFLDFTNRKQVEEALRESEGRFHTLADNIAQLAWMADETGWIFWYNHRWYDYTGTTLKDTQGWGWQNIHHPDHIERVVAHVKQCFEAGEIWEDRFPLRGKDGQYRWFLSRALPIRNAKGRVVRWFGTNTDINDQIEIEEQLHLANAALRHSNEELESFTYVVSHDLQSPLATIGGIIQLLARRHGDAVGQEGRKMLDMLTSGVARTSKLISDLLTYCKLTVKDSLPEKAIDCNNAYSWAIMNLQPQIAETGAVITSDQLPMVRADDRLFRVFQNLIENAIKYRSDRTPEINLSAQAQGQFWIIGVRDNGIGLDMKYADRIFGIFQRLHGQDKYQGSGIGLATCKNIIEGHGGRMWVESTLGEGSTFFFSAPVAEGKCADSAVGS